MFEMSNAEAGITTNEKLKILADAAKYDVACTSSGVDRRGKKGFLGNSAACGICHSFGADGRCISLLKVLMTNHCIYDCKYCANRVSNDVPRAEFEPEELCRLVMEFYKRNYIEGLFLSSGVFKTPAYTMERMCIILSLLRNKYHFNGYIHVKTIPGAPDELLAAAGYLADRISVNLELPTAESLEKLAPNKSFKTILDPMGKVTDTIAAHRIAIGKDSRMERSTINRYLAGSIFNSSNYVEDHRKPYDVSDRAKIVPGNDNVSGKAGNVSDKTMNVSGNYGAAGGGNETDKIFAGLDKQTGKVLRYDKDFLPVRYGDNSLKRAFAPAGQSTQMIVGATEETDYILIRTSQTLYQNYDLKRVFYSAYVPLNEDAVLPALDTAPPLLREHRLYQADWLLRYYGFRANELLSEARPNFNEKVDPKCDWALRNLGDFPVEVQTATYDKLLRVPGIGPKSAGRIMSARRYGSLTYESLKKMGVVLKRAHYFITCNGRMMFNTPIEEEYITRHLVEDNYKDNWKIEHQNEKYHQMSLFDDFNLT